MNRFAWFIAAGAASLSGQVAAQEAPVAAASGRGVISAAVTAGTLGIGPEVGFRFSDHIGVRGSATFLGVSSDFDFGRHHLSRQAVKLKSFGAMVDVHPFGGAFRVSAGARINRNRVNVSATPNADSGGTVTVGDEEFTAAQVGTLTGRATVEEILARADARLGREEPAGRLLPGGRRRPVPGRGTLARLPGQRVRVEQRAVQRRAGARTPRPAGRCRQGEGLSDPADRDWLSVLIGSPALPGGRRREP